MIDNKFIEALNKKFGDDQPVVSWFDRPRDRVAPLSTGSLIVDRLTGLGGLPRGRFTEIFGAPGGGKSTLCYAMAAAAQREGKPVLYLDSELTFFPDWAEKFGLDLEPGKFLMVQTTEGEQGFDILEHCIRTGEFGLVVVDSIAGLRPAKELQGSMDDNFMGLHPRMVNRGLALIKYPAFRTNTPVVFVNQVRQNLGAYGAPTTTPGGQGMKHDMSLRLQVSRGEDKKRGTAVVGFEIKVRLVKNKTGQPVRETPLVRVSLDDGISQAYEALMLGQELGATSRKGAWWYLDLDGVETRLGQGEDGALATLAARPELVAHLVEAIRAAPLADYEVADDE